MTTDKNIKYINKTFSDFKSSLVEFSKQYFPNTYNDFSDASPGNMFIEMASYVGDVLSFQIDTQIQENFLDLAKEKESLYNLSYMYGYNPKLSYSSTTEVEISQLIPSINGSPDLSYALIIPANTSIVSETYQNFITTDDVDLSSISSDNIIPYSNDFFIIKKSVPVISATVKTYVASFPTVTKFASISLQDNNILQVLDVTDDNNNKWYEVPFLAQESIYYPTNNPTSGSTGIDYILNIKRVPHRFVTRVKSNNTLELQFGSGISSQNDEDIIPTLDNINMGLIPNINNVDYNKASVFFTKSYGLAPYGNLTITYLTGGGVTSNVPSNTINKINTDNALSWFKYSPSDSDMKNFIVANILCNNPTPAVGGRDGDTVEEIRLNLKHSFSSQLRAVTKEDYISRSLSLPPKYGNISKAYISQSKALSNDPYSLDLHILTYDNNKKLTNANTVLKENLKTYLNDYRMITDSITIKDAFYINIGINFDLIADPLYNNREILSSCIDNLKTYFSIDKWQINQPIYISEINSILLQTPGVKAVNKIDIINKFGGDYSPYSYDIPAAIRNNILYPSIDPSIFEIRFPNNDIKGRIITY